MDTDALLSNLNASQQAAVSSIADTLAILAGPGSGKTHTLTSRTAWLLAQGLQPWDVIVATFTVKAAREMKERIGKLIGNGMESKLILGTFHSISRRYLARYGHLIGVKKGFGIADSGDSLALIKRIIKRHGYMIDPKVTRSRISECKARGAGYIDGTNKKAPIKSVEMQEFESVSEQYEEALQRSNLLDYDDLLLRCVELLRKHPTCVSNVQAVLIDEFQDTNIVQFDLMRLFAAERKRITIVGDPDQSIYGFRAAEIKNYKRMLQQYPETVTIALEENYRSSGAILLGALSVIKQDSSRVDKSLLPTHSVGSRPVLRKLSGAHKEAEWIVTEIQRCKALTGDLLDLNDFAVLVRSASLSRLIESALGKAGIAYRMVGGLRFYDRVEVKTILDYLRVINQPTNNDALARIINTPSRRIGDVTTKSLLEEADKDKITLWQLILDSVQGRRTIRTQIKKAKDNSLTEFVNLILTARKKIKCHTADRTPIGVLIDYVLQKTDYENWLKQHHDDVTGARWENVQELITQAADFETLLSIGFEDDTLPEVDGLNQEDDDDCLSKFLANVALASEVKTEDGEGTPQITLSTIHAAKGLEWPVVFIPAAYQGSIPHSRAEDTNEERRLLYVAMTRAKVLLYISCPMKSSQSESTVLSPFLSSSDLKPHLAPRGPSLHSSVVQSISQILRRACPSYQSIVESSAGLPSLEDDRFPLDGEEQAGDRAIKWNLTQGSQIEAAKQPVSKRRKLEPGTLASDSEASPGVDWKPSYSTTMSNRSTHMSSSITTMSGFVTAGQVQVSLASTAVSCNNESRRPVAEDKSRATQGQGTLFGFLGKPEPLPPAPTWKELARERREYSQASTSILHNITLPRNSTSQPTAPIDPILAAHRIVPKPAGIRPRASPLAQQAPRNDYVFLSSSPPRQKLNSREDTSIPEEPGLPGSPPAAPIVGSLTSMHTTSLDIMRSDGPKRTLGMRRSMNAGWMSQKGAKFKPPGMKRAPT